jgi:hypothetical protein
LFTLRVEGVEVHLRGIPAEIERLAKAEAARRGITLSEFISQAIVLATRAHESDAGRRLAPLAVERVWYGDHREEVAHKYGGKIVAILNSGVIYAGDTLVDVATDVRSRVGDRPVYVVNLAIPRKPILAPSPARGVA